MIMGKIIKRGVPYGGSSNSAGNISYDNSASDLNSLTVQNAITELDGLVREKLTQYSVMPTASAEYVGKVVQYVGATNANYIQGCFYIAATDGAAEPTYSWVKIGGYREVELYSNDEHAATPVDTVITLSQNWADFDAIGFVSEYNDEVGLCSYNEYKVSIISTANHIMLNLDVGSNTNSIIFIGKNASSSFVVAGTSLGVLSHVYKIIGIKY